MPQHPAKYTDSFIPVFNDLLQGREKVFDPFAGTGKLAEIKNFGFSGQVFCNEIEIEWAEACKYYVDKWTICDAEFLPYENKFFDAICTSPTYGNRMADHFNAKDDSKRITYRHYLGKPLNIENTGRMQWGDKYKNKHANVYKECLRVLKLDGIFILNISDHIRKGELINVSDWHKQIMIEIGFALKDTIQIKTRRMKFGENNKLRVDYENIFVFSKEEKDDPTDS